MRERFKREIYKQGENITSFADKVGLSRWTIMDIIKEKHKTINGATIHLISCGLGKTYEETEALLNDKD